MSTLKSQMRPHFTFNALNSIQSSILLKENDKAFDYLNKFSRLLRSMLYISSNSLISLESEIEMLRNYIALESLQFSSNFEFNIEIQSSIDSNKYLMPISCCSSILDNQQTRFSAHW
ncbi:MAG: histidine kinase [Bacteroidia bacterium]